MNAIRDVGRVLKIKTKIATDISKRFSYQTFEECLKNNPTIIDEYPEPEYQELFRIASKISGRLRGVGIHAGAVCIVDTDINNYMAIKLGEKNGERVIQVDKRVVEEIGIIKFDILGVSTLTLVQDVMEEVGLTPWDLDVGNPVFENDIMSYDLLCRADTNAVFQVESAGMKDLLLRLKPRNLEELSAVIALYRPDSMGALEEFIACKHDPSKVYYINEDMEPILGVTYGCMIYQEQLLDIVKKFGGRTYGGADKFRKGVSKKDEVLVKMEADKLYNEIIQNNYDESLAKIISDDLRSKGSYLFNKSHSFAYAVLCLQTAYLKAHYPIHFYKALLNLKKKENGKINKYINDAIENGIIVKPPHINKSDLNFKIVNNEILFGLSSINGLGDGSLGKVIEQRNIGGSFKNMDDLINRTSITESQIVILIKAGALPCKNKENMMMKYVTTYLLKTKPYEVVVSLPRLQDLRQNFGIDTTIYKTKEDRLRIYNAKKEELYYLNQEKSNEKIINSFREKYMNDKEMWEFEALSYFLTYNPFEEVKDYITPYDDAENGYSATIVGVISNIVKKKDRNKRPFAFLTLSTAFGLIEVACWSNIYAQYMNYLEKGIRVAILCNKYDDKFSAVEIKSFKKWKKDSKIG